jgi:D-sedoheptulose 7-phosphate isomerase
MKRVSAFEHQVRDLIKASIAAKQNLLRSARVVNNVARVAELLVASLRRGNKVILFGNGGSAADAQHIAAELVGRFALERPALSALALSVNSASLTAIANDYGFDRVFSRQLEAFGRPGDVAIGISTSGKSRNVARALAAAKKMGLHTVALTGRSGGDLRENADLCICVPSEETPRIQECHVLIGHILSEMVEYEIFHEKRLVLDC